MEDGIEAETLPEQPVTTTESIAEEEVPGSMPEANHGHAPHGHGSGIPWLDIIVTISVVFISVLSLVISIEHGRTMEKMVDQNQKMVVASTLPLLTVNGGNYDIDANKPRAYLALSNEGVGPAIIYKFEVRYKGVDQTPQTILKACCAQIMGKNEHPFTYSNVSGRILPAREKIDLITIKQIGADDKLVSAFNEVRYHDLSFRICYCSVLEECWENGNGYQRPQPVKECKLSPNEMLW